MKPLTSTTAIRENRDGRHAWDGRTIEEPAGLNRGAWLTRFLLAAFAVGIILAIGAAP
jgi:hypothetical protein